MEPEHDVEAIEIRLLLEAIHAKYGYDLRGYSPASMRRRVLAALVKSGLGTLSELQHALLHAPDSFATLLDGLTVHVSEMFRDPVFYRTLRSCVMPILRTYPLLKIWHAGCATGEEVYATAIVLQEEGLYDRSQIYATDLSPQALEQAKQGAYLATQLQTCSENYAKSGGTSSFGDYYTAAYDQFAMKESLRRNVLFFQHDLVSDHVFGEMHVVFCRNVLIYFGPDLRDEVLGKFSESLCPGGFLCLGASERLARSAKERAFADFAPAERIYRYKACS